MIYTTARGGTATSSVYAHRL